MLSLSSAWLCLYFILILQPLTETRLRSVFYSASVCKHCSDTEYKGEGSRIVFDIGHISTCVSVLATNNCSLHKVINILDMLQLKNN